MQLPSPSQIFYCQDIASCFQALYNFFFMLLLALSFLVFVYGAFQYILSGSGIFAKEEAKKRMKNSLIAVVIVLAIPSLLNLINPEIFSGLKIDIPTLKVVEGPIFVSSLQGKFNRITFKDSNVKINAQIVPKLEVLDKLLEKFASETASEIEEARNLKIRITSSYNPSGLHKSSCHYKGTCIDFTPDPPVDPSVNCVPYLLLKRFLDSNKSLFGNYLFERTDIELPPKKDKCTGKSFSCTYITRDGKKKEVNWLWLRCPQTTAAHIHLEF